MTDHPIAPPLELVEQWLEQSLTSRELAAKAFQAGADQELEACCALLDKFNDGFWCKELRTARRPKLPSLKEQALLAIDVAVADGRLSPGVSNCVRRALEALDD